MQDYIKSDAVSSNQGSALDCKGHWKKPYFFSILFGVAEPINTYLLGKGNFQPLILIYWLCCKGNQIWWLSKLVDMKL